MSTVPHTLSVEDLKAIYIKLGWNTDWTDRELREGYGMAVAARLRLEEAKIEKTDPLYWILPEKGKAVNCLRAIVFLGKTGYGSIEVVFLPPTNAGSPIDKVFTKVFNMIPEDSIVIREAEDNAYLQKVLPNNEQRTNYKAYFDCMGGGGGTLIKGVALTSSEILALNLLKALEDVKYKEIQTFAMGAPLFWDEKYGKQLQLTNPNRLKLYIPKQIIAVGKFKEYQSDPKYSEIKHTLVEFQKVNEVISSTDLTTPEDVKTKKPSTYEYFVVYESEMMSKEPTLVETHFAVES